jgi:predicted transcriptional regulator
MAGPKGSLTAAQYEILNAVWEAGSAGVTVADIWQAISRTRALGRTTVLNQVDRLEKRGWLRRVPGDGITRFQATLSREEASRQLVAGFVSDYFQGSGVELVSALLGTEALTLSRSDVERLRKLLDQARRRRTEEKP